MIIRWISMEVSKNGILKWSWFDDLGHPGTPTETSKPARPHVRWCRTPWWRWRWTSVVHLWGPRLDFTCAVFFPWNLPLLMLWDEIRNRTPQILEGIVFWIVFVPSNSDPRVLQILRPVGALGCSFSSRRTFSLSQDGSVCSVSSCLGFHLAMDQYSYG